MPLKTSTHDTVKPRSMGPSRSDSSGFRSWMVLTAGFFLVFVLYGTYYSFAVFLKPLLLDLKWSRAQTTGAISVYMIVHGASSIAMGWLCDRFGPRLVVAVNVIIVAIGYGLTSSITEIWQLYIYFGLMIGIGMGAAFVPPITTVAKWFTNRRGLALGIVAAGVGVGQMVIPPTIRYAIISVGWRTSFLLMAGMVFIFGTIAALLFSGPPDSLPPQDQDDNKSNHQSDISKKGYQEEQTVKEAVLSLPFVLTLLAFMAMIFCMGIVLSQLVVHMEDIGIKPVAAAMVITLIGISGIFGRISLGGAADLLGNNLILAACLLLQMIVLFSLIFAKDLWEFYLLALLFGFGYGGFVPIVTKMSSDFFGLKSAGTILGILIFGGTSGGAIGAPFAGYIFDRTGSYVYAFLSGGVVLSVAVIIALFIKPPVKAVRQQ